MNNNKMTEDELENLFTEHYDSNNYDVVFQNTTGTAGITVAGGVLAYWNTLTFAREYYPDTPVNRNNIAQTHFPAFRASFFEGYGSSYGTIKQYAAAHGREESVIRRHCINGRFKTARKNGRDWTIDMREPYIENSRNKK